MNISSPDPSSSSLPPADSEKEALLERQKALRVEYEGLNRLLETQSKAFQEALDAQNALSLENQRLVKELGEQIRLVKALEQEKIVLQESYRTLAARSAKGELAKQPQTTPIPPTPAERESVLNVSTPMAFGSLVSGLAKPGSGAVSSTLKKAVATLHGAMPYFVRHTHDPQAVGDAFKQVMAVYEETQRSGILLLHQLAAALRIMFEDYKQTPSLISAPSLRTFGQTIDLLLLIVEKQGLAKLKNLVPLNILAVDDDAGVLDILSSQLGALGMNMVGCKDPREAVPALAKQPFDLILLDIGMAGHNGFEICSNIRKLEGYRHTPVVFITGLATDELKDQSKLVGGNDFVEKPFHAAALGLKSAFWALKGRMD